MITSTVSFRGAVISAWKAFSSVLINRTARRPARCQNTAKLDNRRNAVLGITEIQAAKFTVDIHR